MTAARFPSTGTMSLSCYGLAADELVAVARVAEQVGFDGVWLGEHVVTPVRYVSEHPYPSELHPVPIVGPGTALVDPLVALAAVGAATSRLFVATGVCVMPIHQPVLLARAGVTLHSVTNGRFVMGGGTGWFVEEFEAVGASFAERGARMDEIVEIVTAAWRGGPVSHRGTHYGFDPLVVTEHPVDIPLVLSGEAPRALRRAARWAHGWRNPSSMGLDGCRAVRTRLAELLVAEGRRAEEFDHHVSLLECTADAIDAYRREGFVHLSFPTFGRWRGRGVDLAEKLDDVARLAEIAGLSARP